MIEHHHFSNYDFSSTYDPRTHDPLEVTTLNLDRIYLGRVRDEQITSFFQRFAAVKTLDLSTTTFKESNIIAIPQILHGLTALNLSRHQDFNKSLISAIGKALSSFSALKSLRLRDCSLGDEGIVELCRSEVFGSRSGLSFLDLYNCKITTKGFSLLGPQLQTSTSLKSLSLGLNRIGGAPAHTRPFNIAAIVASVTTLSFLDLSSCDLSMNEIANVVEALQSNSNLQNLQLSGNNTYGRAADSIASLLSSDFPLQELNLDYCSLSGHTTALLANALQQNSQLKVLDLSTAEMSHEASAALEKALKINTTLQSLVIAGLKLPGSSSESEDSSGSEDSFGAGGSYVKTVLDSIVKNNTTLTTLKLYTNDYMPRIDTVPMLRNMLANTTLTELAINLEFDTNRSTVACENLLLSNTTLQILSINSIESDTPASLLEAMKHNGSLTNFKTSDYNMQSAFTKLMDRNKHNLEMQNCSLFYMLVVLTNIGGGGEVVYKASSNDM